MSKNKMKPKAPRSKATYKWRSEEERRGLLKSIEERIASGESTQIACKKMGVSPGVFYSWRKKITPEPIAGTDVIFHEQEASALTTAYVAPMKPRRKSKPTGKVAIVICDASNVGEVLAGL